MAQTLSDSAVARANTNAVRAACERLGVPYEVHDTYGNFISLKLGTGAPQHFVNFATPFNNSSVNRICKDKEFTWRLLKDVIAIPKTKGYFDPYASEEGYAPYINEKNYETIAKEIVADFKLPVIVKMNTGSMGKNVFLCTSYEEVLAALTNIYTHASASYDYIALAQEYVEPKKEYRAVIFKREVVLAYEKDISAATFAGNLSPLHYEGAVARQVTDAALIARMNEFIQPLFSALDVEFAGLDIILDSEGNFTLLELNAQPGFAHFVRDNGQEALIAMYEKMIQSLK